MAKKHLPPTDKDPAWKGFGEFPAGWDKIGDLNSWQAVFPDGELLPLKQNPVYASGTHPYIHDYLEKNASKYIYEIKQDATLVFDYQDGNTAQVIEINVKPNAKLVIHQKINSKQKQSVISSIVINAGKKCQVDWRTTIKNNQAFAILNREINLKTEAISNLDIDLKSQGKIFISSCQKCLKPESKGNIGSAVQLSGEARFNHKILQEFSAPHCQTDCNERVIITGKAISNFNGNILINKKAQQTEAFQTHRALLLSDNGKSNATPALEIKADDVRCSHAATTSRLDEEMLFYLRSRGIPTAKAKKLLIEAFLAQANLTPLLV